MIKQLANLLFVLGSVSLFAQTPGIDVANMDLTVSPKDDFYTFVNGNWVKNNSIPDDKSIWGGFSVLRENVNKDMLSILDEMISSKDFDASSDKGKAITLFDAYLDSTARVNTGYEPIVTLLKKIDTVSSIKELQELLSKNVAISSPYISLSIFPNLNNSSANAAYLGSNDLGLERDYYLNDDANSKEIIEKYEQHTARMFETIGMNDVDVAKIVALERQIAPTLLSKVEKRDTRNYNNYRSLKEVQEKYPFMDWTSYLNNLGIKSLDSIFVAELKYFDFATEFVKDENLEDIKLLTKWSTLNNLAAYLTPELEVINWEFYSKTLRGTKSRKPKEKTALAIVNANLGEAVGQVYVDSKFPPEAKQSAKEMIDYLVLAFEQRIQNLDWMSQETKAKAIEKLNKINVKIGYPDKWENYENCAIEPTKSYFENRIAIKEYKQHKSIKELTEKVDKSKWFMSPQTVNAYYNPLYNEIVFPAAILQPPFFNYKADMAVNLGGIGAVIGHEISHAFDDSGSRFDANGNLSNWWIDEDLEQFTTRANLLSEQFSKVEVLDSVFVNGAFTLGENIGDLGGVLAAYDALQMFIKDNGTPDKIDGYTAEQRFFISWATIWRTLSREAFLNTLIKTDPHSPGKIRATQPLRNIDSFYKAFDIKPGDPMYMEPAERVRIW